MRLFSGYPSLALNQNARLVAGQNHNGAIIYLLLPQSLDLSAPQDE